MKESILKEEIRKFRKFVHRMYHTPKLNQKLIDTYHEFYYNSAVHKKTKWFGVPTWKLPSDLWIYQEIINEIKPNLIIETGTAYGGSALYIAQLLDHLKKGKIVTIDIDNKPERPIHNRIIYFHGSSTDMEIFEKVKQLIKKKDKILVILDSDHSENHVFTEMEMYCSLVTLGSYLIVEDSNINGHPVWKEYGPGPMEAIKKFLKRNSQFQTDKSKEKFLMTWNPNGFLKRIK